MSTITASKGKGKPKKEVKKPKKGAPKSNPAKEAPKTVSNGVVRGRPTNEVRHAASREKMRQATILLKQVSDPARVQVLMMLHSGGRHVGAISEALGQSQPASSHHLAILRHGRIVEVTRDGKRSIYSLTAKGLLLGELVAALI